ncbi:MAG: hypothetical protein ABI868_21370 [Acidobacteriota bacterium]
MLTSLAIVVIASVACQVLLVAALSAWRRAGNVYRTIVVVCFITVPLAWFADRLLLGQVLDRDTRLFFMLIHLALGGFFFHFMTLPDRSVTLRILVELLVAPGQALTAKELGRRYGVKTMITSRLEQLSAGRFLAIDGSGRIELTAKGAWFGRFVTAGRKLFRIASAN